MDVMNNLLSSFGKVIGIPGLKFDEDNYCCLLFDDVCINLELDERTGQLCINAPLGPIPEDADPVFFEMLLEANYFFRQTGGATLGMNRAANVIHLVYQIPAAGLDLVQFEQIMENLISIAETWMEKIRTGHRQTETSASVPAFDLNLRV